MMSERLYRLVPAFFGNSPVKADPMFERELVHYLKAEFSVEQRLELYNRHKALATSFDALLRRVLLKSLCKKAGDDIQVANNVELRNPEVIELGSHIYLAPGVNLQGWWKGQLIIGDNVWLGSNAFIDGKDVTLRGDIGVGPGVIFIGSEHTGLPADVPMIKTDLRISPIVVERGVDIGANATILPGVTIGENSIIGAGAVVTRDVAPGTVVAGVPARVLKARGE